MESLDTKTLLLYSLAPVAAIAWLRSREKSTIPAIAGPPGFISSYLPALHFVFHAKDVLHRGYSQYRDGVFRVPTLFRWDYVACGAQRVAEIVSAPDHILSFVEGADDNIQTKYTIGREAKNGHVFAVAIRGSLTRNLGRCFPEVRDEIVHAFDDVLLLEDNEWKEIKVSPSLMQVVARTSNRLFVGLPLCREKEYLELAINHTISVVTRGQIIALLPGLLKPILGPLISARKSSLRQGLKFLGPLIDERLEQELEHGRDWPDKPNDLISWLLENVEGQDRTTPSLTVRILGANMAAIHTSSMALTAALYDLTTYPVHILPMREEAERVISEEGWSKAALSKMHKIDSFLRESQRLAGGGDAISLKRKVVAKDGFTFSDGTKIPYGSFLGVPGLEIQYDPDNYENPATFDGFRFSRLRDECTDQNSSERHTMFNRHMVTTAQDHVVFGHGQHACPGRFFAATELKAMLAHILMNYDVKATKEGIRPADLTFGTMTVPNLRGTIMIRKRA
ncbi:cytochrome P450 [Mycena latifolia]|nr:cytochrome P450 [Mycena latifolia]